MGALSRLIQGRPRLLAAAAAAVLLGGAVGAVFVGFKIGDQKLATYDLWKKVDTRIASIINGGQKSSVPDKLQPTTIETGLVKLVTDVRTVDVERRVGNNDMMAFTGGGMTSLGDDLLLLTFTGTIYADKPGEDPRLTGMQAPDTNREAFAALEKDPAYEGYSFNADYVRYNDLKAYDDGTKRGLLASYSEFDVDGKCFHNTVARLDIDRAIQSIDQVKAGPGDWTIIYRSKPCLPLKKRFSAVEAHMAGGRMAVLNPTTVVLTNGDYHNDGMVSDGPGIAQDPTGEYGKVMQIDIQTGASRILSMGHRNQQGIAIDDKGDIYIAEHGPQGGDELNRIVDGKNYGWPKESLGISYSNDKLPEASSYGRHDTFEPPVFAWMPSVAVSSLIYIKPGFHDAWTGDFLAGAFSSSLHRIRFANGRPIYSESIQIGSRIRAMHQHSNGQIVLWTDNRELIWLKGEDRGSDTDVLKGYIANRKLDDTLSHKFEMAVSKCAECHSFDVGDSARSPSLARIYGDPIASTGFANYSPGLSGKSGQWTSENLTAFLSNPQAFAPGTMMPQVADDPKVVATVVDYLRHFDGILAGAHSCARSICADEHPRDTRDG